MTGPLKAALERDPDFFCGQIIFQKDGCNMAKRTPVATGLEKQLALLAEYGYSVVTVEELMRESPFADVGRDDPDFGLFASLAGERAVAFSDNTVRPDQPMTVGELAALITPREESLSRRLAVARRGEKVNAYTGAMEYCKEKELIPSSARENSPVTDLPSELFRPTGDYTRRGVLRALKI